MLGIGILLSYLTANDVAAGIHSHPAAVLEAAGVTLFVGAWLMLAGLGDTEDPPRPSPTVRNGLIVAAGLGFLWGTSFHLELLAYLVRY